MYNFHNSYFVGFVIFIVFVCFVYFVFICIYARTRVGPSHVSYFVDGVGAPGQNTFRKADRKSFRNAFRKPFEILSEERGVSQLHSFLKVLGSF